LRILLVSQYYWPESFGAGVWIAELAEGLALRGHEVTVVTAFPNHPEGIVFPAYRGRFFQREQRNGVRILRTWLHATERTGSLLQRILGQASFSASLLLGCAMAPKADVIWYASPPLPGALTAWIASCWHRAKYVLNIADIEPERSVALGLFKNRLLIRVLEGVERFAYRHAERICVLSEGTREWLAKKGVPLGKLSITPNWADGQLIQPLPAERSLRQELGLEDRFVVLYSGNMGYTMGDLETVVDGARLLAGDEEVHFVLAGEGVRREAILARAEGLKNITFLPLQSRERFPRLLATADVALVLLCGEASQASVPSKTYSIMAAGRPVIAICSPENDTARVVANADCGEQIAPGDSEHFASAVRRYRDDRKKTAAAGARARAYFEGHYTSEVGMTSYEAVFSECVECGSRASAETGGRINAL
jgi:colanic acid biosynthesis glycosyl transferase WcaI